MMQYDANTPRIAQTDAWSCSVASTTWLLRSLGIDVSYPPMEQRMVRDGLVSPADGLLTGSGGPLRDWLDETWAVPAENLPSASWAAVCEHAGRGPLIMGGHRWYHWVGVRRVLENGNLALANPA